MPPGMLHISGVAWQIPHLARLCALLPATCLLLRVLPRRWLRHPQLRRLPEQDRQLPHRRLRHFPAHPPGQPPQARGAGGPRRPFNEGLSLLPLRHRQQGYPLPPLHLPARLAVAGQASACPLCRGAACCARTPASLKGSAGGPVSLSVGHTDLVLPVRSEVDREVGLSLCQFALMHCVAGRPMGEPGVFVDE